MGILADFDLQRIRDKFRCRFLVETGTGRGGGIDYARRFDFERIYSIEITPELATAAQQRFSSQKQVSVLNTDSETGLKEILSKLPPDVPAAFWLDAHFPGADYGYAKYDSEADVDRRLPLQREMELIARLRNVERDVFLIDDLRIYEDGPFEMGSIGHFGSRILPEQRDIGFIETLLGRTHVIERLYFKTGYIVVLPRNAGDPAASDVHLLAAASAALDRDDAEEAERIADQVHRVQPTDGGAPVILARVARRRHQFVHARTLLEQVVATASNHIEAHLTLGLVQQDLECFAEAETAFRLALALAPESGRMLFHLGNFLAQQDRPAEAIPLLRRAAAAGFASAPVHLILASTLHRHGDAEGAAEMLAQVQSLDETASADFERLASILQRNGTRLPLGVWKRLAEMRPTDAVVHLQFAIALGGAGKRDEARAILRRFAGHDSTTAAMLFEIGKALVVLDDEGTAADAYRRVIALEPAHAAAHNNLAMILFLDGRFEEAWPHHEWRFKAKQRPRPPYAAPRLAAADISGRTLFLHGEQGLGDNIQFLRYAKILHERGNRILIGIRKELAGLFAAQPYVDEVITEGDVLPAFDFELPLLSLPALFRTRLDDIPAEIPYLRVPPEKLSLWRDRLKDTPKPRIGLVWAGNPGHYNDANRSIPGDIFLRLTELSRHTFVALQKPWPPTSPKPESVTDLGAEFTDFDDTAGALMQLDLVISIDTSVAHLAGALGRKVWVLLPTPCDWRWTRAGETTPWYPQARLFRQKSPGDWAEVLDRVRQELAAFKPG